MTVRDLLAAQPVLRVFRLRVLRPFRRFRHLDLLPALARRHSADPSNQEKGCDHPRAPPIFVLLHSLSRSNCKLEFSASGHPECFHRIALFRKTLGL